MSEIIALLINVIKEITDNLITVFAALAGVIAREISGYLRNILISLKNYIINSGNKSFTISGIWLADFMSSYIEKKHIYELIKINQDQEKIQLYIQHYNNIENDVLTVEGNGIFRVNKISAVYYPTDRSDIRSGVFALKTRAASTGRGVELTGNYIEYDSRKDPEELYTNENYTLKRIKFPLINRLKMNLHFQCFKNYNDLNLFVIGNRDSKQ